MFSFTGCQLPPWYTCNN